MPAIIVMRIRETATARNPRVSLKVGWMKIMRNPIVIGVWYIENYMTVHWHHTIWSEVHALMIGS